MKTLMIVHIPKAAGTTLRWIMDRQWPQEEIFKVKSDIASDKEKLRQTPNDEKMRFRAVFGHYCYGLHSYLAPGQKFEYVTILREPTERVVSLYQYVRNESPAHYLNGPALKMSLGQFVTSGVTCTVDNGMVRQLCGVDGFTMYEGVQEPYNDMKIEFGKVGKKHLEMAKENLATFGLVGMVGKEIEGGFDRFLNGLRVRYTWRVPPYDNKNVTRRKHPIEPQELDIVRKRNILDYRLFEFAKGLQGEQ
jgi:hypothetical protein